MAVPLSTTGVAVKAAITLRLVELGHALSPSHIAALTADIMTTINANSGTVVADAAMDTLGYQPPAHGKF